LRYSQPAAARWAAEPPPSRSADLQLFGAPDRDSRYRQGWELARRRDQREGRRAWPQARIIARDDAGKPDVRLLKPCKLVDAEHVDL